MRCNSLGDTSELGGHSRTAAEKDAERVKLEQNEGRLRGLERCATTGSIRRNEEEKSVAWLEQTWKTAKSVSTLSD